MERKLTMLAPFFEEPNKKFGLRELSRNIGINHTTVRSYLLQLTKEGYLSSEEGGVYTFYQLVLSDQTRNLKSYYNMEKLRKSHFLEDLNKAYDYPVVVLFGSYAIAEDDIDSDIDICIISNIKKEFPRKKYESLLRREVSIHLFTNEQWDAAKKKHPHLVNNICNGRVLSGELVVV